MHSDLLSEIRQADTNQPESEQGVPPGSGSLYVESAAKSDSRDESNTVETEALRALLSPGAAAPLIIDVRPSDTYTDQHIVGAVNIPLAELGDRRAELPEDRDAAIVTVCNRGNMSLSGMLFLQSLGYRRVTSLNGGTLAWADEGHPVE